MQMCLDEAKASYAEDVVVVLQSENTDQLQANIDRVVQWVSHWLSVNQG